MAVIGKDLYSQYVNLFAHNTSTRNLNMKKVGTPYERAFV